MQRGWLVVFTNTFHSPFRAWVLMKNHNTQDMRFYLSFSLFLFSIAFLFLLSGCQFAANEPEAKALFTAHENSNEFARYWFAGEAELNTFDIIQNRYGEEREGETVMVFVTEDFSSSKQVKLDDPASAGNDKVPVLKLNHIRRFVTGIYDYSMMQSVFTPVDLKKNKNTLKLSTTAQDWCGHSFTQLNLEGEKYRATGFSYFESVGDNVKKIKTALLEDELWNRIRIAPENIPTGTVEVIPSTFFSHLHHAGMKPKQARIQYEKGAEISYIILEYLHLERSLRIGFETEFPHKILEWKEEMDGRLESSGKLKATMKAAYWRKHDNSHVHLRDSLRLH